MKNMMRKKLFLFICVISLLSLAGCATYHAEDLSSLEPSYTKEYEGNKGLLVGSKLLTEQESKIYLGRNVIKQGYQPILLSFHNTTEDEYVFLADKLNVPCVSSETVAESVHTSTKSRIIGYTTGAVLVGTLFASPLVSLPTVFGGIFLAPTFVDGIKSSNANKSLDQDYARKAQTCVTIAPHSYMKTLIFVPSEFLKPVLNIELVNEKTEEIKTIYLPLYQ